MKYKINTGIDIWGGGGGGSKERNDDYSREFHFRVWSKVVENSALSIAGRIQDILESAGS